jgi:hypothetical protein
MNVSSILTSGFAATIVLTTMVSAATFRPPPAFVERDDRA